MIDAFTLSHIGIIIMRNSFALSLLSTLALSAALSPAGAQDLSAAEVVALIKGKTLYQDLPGGPRGKGPAMIYYGDDNKLAAKFPNGTSPKGTWSAKDNTICTVWDDQPVNPCTRYRKDGDKITTINVETGQVRGVIDRIVAGNPDRL
jgi:hypothetical protein